MATFVTGASGFIGGKLCRALANRSEQVVAFCRSQPTDDLLNHPLIRIAIGDVRSGSCESIVDAMQGCRSCIHLAGLARQWSRKSSDFDEVNFGGTVNVLDAAINSDIRKFVFVSTAGVYGPSDGDNLIVEASPIPKKFGTDYERSKRNAELAVLEHVSRYDLNACIVCPTRVFGPGKPSEANGITRIMDQYEAGQWRLMPGDGSAVGNYVCVDDVVSGLTKVLERGQAGRRYILGGENLSYRELFGLIAEHSSKPRTLTKIPYPAAMAFAQFQLVRAWLFGIEPKLTPPFVRKYFRDYRISCQRTKEEIGYAPSSISTAIAKTMHWLQAQV